MDTRSESPRCAKAPARRPRWWPYALAAVMVHLVAVGLAWWVSDHRWATREDGLPVVQVELFSFAEATADRVAALASQSVELTQETISTASVQAQPPLQVDPQVPADLSVKATEPVETTVQAEVKAQSPEDGREPVQEEVHTELTTPDPVALALETAPLAQPAPPPAPPRPVAPVAPPGVTQPPPASPINAAASRSAPLNVATALSTPPSFDAGYLKNPAPRYPLRALRQRVEGTVWLSIHVLPSGEGGEVKLHKSSGSELLDEAALSTVRGWRFKPATLHGNPVAQWVNVPITFRITPQ